MSPKTHVVPDLTGISKLIFPC